MTNTIEQQITIIQNQITTINQTLNELTNLKNPRSKSTLIEKTQKIIEQNKKLTISNVKKMFNFNSPSYCKQILKKACKNKNYIFVKGVKNREGYVTKINPNTTKAFEIFAILEKNMQNENDHVRVKDILKDYTISSATLQVILSMFFKSEDFEIKYVENENGFNDKIIIKIQKPNKKDQKNKLLGVL